MSYYISAIIKTFILILWEVASITKCVRGVAWYKRLKTLGIVCLRNEKCSLSSTMDEYNGLLQSSMKGRQFREEWKVAYPWLVVREGKCFRRMFSWMTECMRSSPIDQVSSQLTLNGFSNRKKALSGVVKSIGKHPAGSILKLERSEAHSSALVAYTTSRQGNDSAILPCEAFKMSKIKGRTSMTAIFVCYTL